MSGKTRKRQWCRACERAWQAGRPIPETRRVKRAAWLQTNAERVQQYKRDWRARNAEYDRAQRRARHLNAKLRVWQAAR